MKILLYIIVSFLIILIINIITNYLNKYLFNVLLDINESGLESEAYSSVTNSFILTKISFLIILIIYISIIYLSKVYKYDYQFFLLIVVLYIYIKYKIEIGGCKLIEHLYIIKFEFSKLTKQEWEVVYFLGSIRVYKGKFWIIWEPLKKKIEVKR